MGISNLTSSIRASKSVSISDLKSVEATHAAFDQAIASSLTILNNPSVINTLPGAEILTIKDVNRNNKILSVGRSILSFAIHHNIVRPIRWLSYNGAIGSNVSGFRFIRDATIVSAVVQAKTIGSGLFEILKNDGALITSVATIALVSESEKTVDDLNIDIEEGSVMEVKLISGEFSYPTLSIEFAWRFTPT